MPNDHRDASLAFWEEASLARFFAALEMDKLVTRCTLA